MGTKSDTKKSDTKFRLELEKERAEKEVITTLLATVPLGETEYLSRVLENGGTELFRTPIHIKLVERMISATESGASCSIDELIKIAETREEAEYILDLIRSQGSYFRMLSSFGHWLDTLIRHTYAEKLSAVGEYIVAKATQDAPMPNVSITATVEDIENRLVTLLTSMTATTNQLHKPKDMFTDLLKDLTEGRPDRETVPTGLEKLDAIITGFGVGDLSILAARPSVGKTAFATQFALNASLQKHGVLIFSLEMTATEITLRLLTQATQIPLPRVKKALGFLKEWDGKASTDKAMEIGVTPAELVSLSTFFTRQWPIAIVDQPALTVHDIQKTIAEGVAQFEETYGVPLKAVIVDYLQLVRTDMRFSKRHEEIGYITRTLRRIARYYDVAMLVLSQLTRGPERRDDKRPTLADLRESGSIEQDADLVILLYKPALSWDEAKNSPYREVVLEIAKNRHGPSGVLRLAFKTQLLSFR